MSIWLCHSEGSESQRDKREGMDYKKREEFLGLRIQMCPAVAALNTQAEELYEMPRKLEELTKDTTIRYAGLRVSVEAWAAFEQAKDLREALEEVDKEMRGEVQGGSQPPRLLLKRYKTLAQTLPDIRRTVMRSY
jgi:plasmid maintenance system antidote protein VapI